MKNLFLLNRLGFNPDLTTRQSRVDSVSILSRQSDLPIYLGRIAAIILLVLTIGVGQMWGTAATLPVDYTFGGSSLPTGVTGNSVDVNQYSSSSHNPYLVRFNATGDYIVIETDAAAEQIIFGVKKIGGDGNSTFTVSGSTNGSSYTDIQTFTISGATNAIVNCTTTVAISANYRYFKFYFTKSDNVGFGVLKISKAASCSSSITITKGDNPDNGTFTLSTSGSVCIDEGNASTTVNATPISHYHLATVTSSGGGNIGSISNNSCTVSNISANTTINVTFAADPTYTVTWVAGTNPSFSTQTNYAGTALTDPGTPDGSTVCGSKVFRGWTATPIVGEVDEAPNDLFTSVSGKSIPEGGTTYYAVFATSSEGGDPDTDTEHGTSTSPYVANDGWTASAGGVYTSSGNYSVNPSIKFNSNNHYVQSPTYDDAITNINFWHKNQGGAGSLKIYVSTDGSSFSELTSERITLTAQQYTVGTKDIDLDEEDGYKAVKIVFSRTSGQCCIDEIAITHGSGTTYSDYATTCSTDPTLTVDPSSLDFGDVASGGSKSLTFTLSGSNLTANASIGVTGTGYSVSPSSVNKDGSGNISSATITVTYAPTSVGDGQTGTVTVTSGDVSETVSLTGNCKASYSVSCTTPTNGTLSADKTANIIAGETVTLTVTPSSGYQLNALTISAGGGSVTPTKVDDTHYTFTMPSNNVTVTATFIERVDFVLVKDVNDLYEGATVVFCNKGEVEQYAKVIGAYAGGNNWPAVSASVFEENDQLKILTTTPNMQTLTLGDGTVNNTWSFSDGTGYICAASSSSNHMKRETTLTANSSFTIEINTTTGEATITAQGTYTRNTMSYNTGVFFSCYASNNTQSPMYIYMIPSNCDKLPAPTGLSVSNITQNSATLSWNAVDHASGYNVSCSGGTVEYTSGTSATVTGLTQGTAYTWSVQATGTGEYCALGLKANGNFTTKRAVTVTYRTNGASGGQLPVTGGVVNLTEGDSHEILANTGSGGSPSPLVKSGYTFDGWHNSSTYSATPAYTIGNSITVNENIVIYANWRPQQDTFFDDMHQTSGYTSGGHIESGNYTMPGPLSNVASGNACETSHYIFVGWVISGGQNPDGTINGSPKIWRAGESNNASGATYYAVWAEE